MKNAIEDEYGGLRIILTETEYKKFLKALNTPASPEVLEKLKKLAELISPWEDD